MLWSGRKSLSVLIAILISLISSSFSHVHAETPYYEHHQRSFIDGIRNYVNSKFDDKSCQEIIRTDKLSGTSYWYSRKKLQNEWDNNILPLINANGSIDQLDNIFPGTKIYGRDVYISQYVARLSECRAITNVPTPFSINKDAELFSESIGRAIASKSLDIDSIDQIVSEIPAMISS